MTKGKDKIQLQVQDELCRKVKAELHIAKHHIDALMETTRETALAKTKIEEAEMWFDKFHEKVEIELAHKTCK